MGKVGQSAQLATGKRPRDVPGWREPHALLSWRVDEEFDAVRGRVETCSWCLGGWELVVQIAEVSDSEKSTFAVSSELFDQYLTGILGCPFSHPIKEDWLCSLWWEA